MLALQPAPVQAHYLGYSLTTGADFVQYLITDRRFIPPEWKKYCAEELVYLPGSFMATRRAEISEAPITRADCDLPKDAFVFANFNHPCKFEPSIFAIWMRLLRRVEGSVLWLIETNPIAAQNLRNEAKAREIPPERLIFAPKLPLADHLARHRHADLFLDTLPYNAHTTASDALWAGVPVLTCLGETFAGRVAASLLRAIGLPELVTTSLADYETLALKLAREPPFLAAIKAQLARNRETYPLFDTARFTRHIEAAYTTMWQRYQRGDPPKTFVVDERHSSP